MLIDWTEICVTYLEFFLQHILIHIAYLPSLLTVPPTCQICTYQTEFILHTHILPNKIFCSSSPLCWSAEGCLSIHENQTPGSHPSWPPQLTWPTLKSHKVLLIPYSRYLSNSSPSFHLHGCSSGSNLHNIKFASLTTFKVYSFVVLSTFTLLCWLA